MPTKQTNLLRKTLSLAALSLIASTSAAASAEQFVAVDVTYEHTADLPDSHYRVDPLPGTPADWKSPIDYASGTAHMHLEVETKPTDTPTRYQACFEATPTYACVGQAPAYTTAGVYDWETPFSDFWSPPGTAVDWTKGTNKIALILKDTSNGKPSADNVGAETAALYMPTKIRFVLTVVAPGSQYIPPPPPDAGAPPPDAGADASTGTGGSGGAGAEPPTPTPKPPVEADSGCALGGASTPAGAGLVLLLVLAGGSIRRSRRETRD